MSDPPKVMVELFAGSAVMATTFENAGFEIFTVDIEDLSRDPDHPIDLVRDIIDVEGCDLPARPYVVWASPPCTQYSFAKQKDRAFGPGGVPLTDDAHQANRLVQKTLSLIEQMDPTYWFLENPRAYLGMQGFMKEHPSVQVAYCQYGEKVKKPTQIWGRHPLKWFPKSHCHHTMHRDTVSNHTGHGMLVPKKDRAVLPQALCDEVVQAVIDSKGAWSFQPLDRWLNGA
jgi:hypothetical protein